MLKYISLFILLILPGCASLDFSTHKDIKAPHTAEIKNTNIIFVLGGGGVRGIAHVGAMEELAEAGIMPDMIIGCSAGAIVGALYADSLDLEHVKNLILNQRREDLLTYQISKLPYGLSEGDELKTFLENNIKAKHFEELKIPLAIVATDLKFGELVTFDQGLLVDTIRASSAFPGIFNPVKFEGRYYTDGGVADSLPVATAKNYNPKFIIAIDLSSALTPDLPNHIFGILQRCIEISYLHHNKLLGLDADYVIKIPFEGIGTFENDKNMEIYNLGRKLARSAISDIKLKMKEKGIMLSSAD